MPLCLIIEDDVQHANMMRVSLKHAGYELLMAHSARSGLTLCRQEHPEIILLDLGLPDRDGLDLLPDLLATSPPTRIVVLSGRDCVSSAVKALQAGACHYLVKPWDRDELLLVLERQVHMLNRRVTAERKNAQLFWGSSPAMIRLRQQMQKIAQSPNTPVLIQGPTGVGKEMLARELHAMSPCAGMFTAVNCASVPATLLESELFGHERGAFTGAHARRRGLVELAKNGTLFLDEIGEMEPSLQPKLLRFLQDHRYRRVGGETELCSECRVVAATHRDLIAMQDHEGFRSDLFYRLAVVSLTVPALQERPEDLLELANFLIHNLARTLGKPVKALDSSANMALLAHSWPGNVRELRNRLERALVLGDHRDIRAEDLDLSMEKPVRPMDGDKRLERRRILATLASVDWNVAAASRTLGVPRHWLRYRMKIHGLSKPHDGDN